MRQEPDPEVDGVSTWLLVDLCRIVRERFGVTYGDTGVALFLTHVSVAAMNLLLEEVASLLPSGTYAAMLIDNAGRQMANDLWVPPNITLVHLPPYSPELNAIEQV